MTRCDYCTPGSHLTGTRCERCREIHRMHIAAETDEFIQAVAVRWIEENAPRLRTPGWMKQEEEVCK